MLQQATFAERFAYGRPLDAADDDMIRTVSRPTVALVARILIGTIFLISGFAKLTDTEQTAAYMTQMGIPAAHTLALVAGCAEVLGALSIIFGVLTRIGAIGLTLFMIPTTLLFHAFWNFTGMEQRTQMVDFVKNLAIIGGLSMLVAFGPGRYSIDAKLRWPKQS